MKYQKRIVVFIDFLGFKNIIAQTVSSEKKLSDLLEALAFTRKHFHSPNFDALKFEKDRVITHFSDSIIISFGISEESGVFYALLDIQHLLLELATKGYICRGGMTFGDMIHTSDIALGPAFISAYEMEKDHARFPRIIVADEIVEIGATFCGRQNNFEYEKKYIESILSRDTDGWLYIDYFEKCVEEFNDPESDLPVYFKSLKNTIQEGLSNPETSVRIKFEWMAQKHDQMAKCFKVLSPQFNRVQA